MASEANDTGGEHSELDVGQFAHKASLMRAPEAAQPTSSHSHEDEVHARWYQTFLLRSRGWITGADLALLEAASHLDQPSPFPEGALPGPPRWIRPLPQLYRRYYEYLIAA